MSAAGSSSGWTATGRPPDQRTGDLATELATRLSVREALAMLPVAQRVAVVLVDVQGWPVAEVAEVLEVPVGTVKSRCARAGPGWRCCSGTCGEEDR